MNLIEGTLAEIDRVNEIIEIYEEEAPPAGDLVIGLMKLDVIEAKRLVGAGDTMRLLSHIQKLKAWTL